MYKRVAFAFILIGLGCLASEARPLHIDHPLECNVTMPCDFPQGGRNVDLQQTMQRSASTRVSFARADTTGGQVVGGRPTGCPRSFCGCGAAMRVFGRIVPELNLASNWLRFPRTAPAPGMVAARRGHVFVLEQHVDGDLWMAYDANSGGHATRIHARSLRGYTIVNPHAA
jgi:hypothetical protein